MPKMTEKKVLNKVAKACVDLETTGIISPKDKAAIDLAYTLCRVVILGMNGLDQTEPGSSRICKSQITLTTEEILSRLAEELVKVMDKIGLEDIDAEIAVNSQTEEEYNNSDTKKAFETIKQAMINDDPGKPGSYAHSWHCNIAMMVHDTLVTHGANSDYAHMIGNEAASRFMKLCFDVNTKA